VGLSERLLVKQMAKFRIRVGCQTLDRFKKTSKAGSIPMIIKNVLIPRVIYGIAIFGHRYDNLGIKRIINSTLRCFIGNNNVSISTIMEELNIKGIVNPLVGICKSRILKGIHANKLRWWINCI
jgi:hypothetical protein